MPPTRALSLHAGYRCGRTGACCTSGWDIPVEPPVERAARAALARGHLAVRGEPFRRPGGTAAGPVVLATDRHGRCAFFEPGSPHACGLQRRLGAEGMPAACRHFPRVALLTPLGVSVSLSHYCPTAARLLFGDDGAALAVVADPPAFPAHRAYEGLDATASLPLLRPGVFLDWEAHRLWEDHTVRTLARGDLEPEAALAVLAADAERVRSWTSGDGALASFMVAAAGSRASGAEAGPRPFADALAEWRLAAACVPDGSPGPAAHDAAALAAADTAWTPLRDPGAAQVVRRYLAARAFASWCGVQGEGLRTAVRYLVLALGVLRVEAARACAAAARGLDETLLLEALRAADLLLLHLAAPEVLARRLSGVEHGRAALGGTNIAQL